MAQSIGYTLAAVGPIAIGAIDDATQSWKMALITLIVLAVVQAAFGSLVTGPRELVHGG